MAKKYDFIIAGGGTSGIITATKLIEHGASVLILEEGIKSKIYFYQCLLVGLKV